MLITSICSISENLIELYVHLCVCSFNILYLNKKLKELSNVDRLRHASKHPTSNPAGNVTFSMGEEGAHCGFIGRGRKRWENSMKGLEASALCTLHLKGWLQDILL